MGHSLKHLSQQSLTYGLSLCFRGIADKRQRNKVDYSMHDSVMSGFGMMYVQNPSLLQFQERLKEGYGRSNLETLFGVKSIPKDTQMRTTLDKVDREQFRPAFKDFTHRPQRGKHLEQFQLWDGSYLVAVDGSEYFSSKKISCPACLKKEHKDGEKTYSHQILQGAIVHPDRRKALPFNARGDSKHGRDR